MKIKKRLNELIKKYWKKAAFALFIALLAGLLLLGPRAIVTEYIHDLTNPPAIINEDCYNLNNGLISLILENPSKDSGNNYNIIIFADINGVSFESPDDHLCHLSESRFTGGDNLIHCDFIPPKSELDIQFRMQSDNLSIIHYRSWSDKNSKQYSDSDSDKVMNCGSREEYLDRRFDL